MYKSDIHRSRLIYSKRCRRYGKERTRDESIIETLMYCSCAAIIVCITRACEGSKRIENVHVPIRKGRQQQAALRTGHARER